MCHIDAHGDGVSQIPVESMDFSLGSRHLVSVAEGKSSIKLWKVEEDGKHHIWIPSCLVQSCCTLLSSGRLSDVATREQPPEYHVPRFVGFTDDGKDIVVGYLENGLV